MLNLPTNSDLWVIFVDNAEFTYRFRAMDKKLSVNMIFL